jgi:hypothetical protein
VTLSLTNDMEISLKLDINPSDTILVNSSNASRSDRNLASFIKLLAAKVE